MWLIHSQGTKALFSLWLMQIIVESMLTSICLHFDLDKHRVHVCALALESTTIPLAPHRNPCGSPLCTCFFLDSHHCWPAQWGLLSQIWQIYGHHTERCSAISWCYAREDMCPAFSADGARGGCWQSNSDAEGSTKWRTSIWEATSPSRGPFGSCHSFNAVERSKK